MRRHLAGTVPVKEYRREDSIGSFAYRRCRSLEQEGGKEGHTREHCVF